MRKRIGLVAAAVLAASNFALARPTSDPTTTEPAPSSPPTTAPTIDNNLSLTSPPAARDEASEPGQLGKVVVTSDLDLARQQIAPTLGASVYTITPTQIQAIPGGQDAPFQKVLLRAPGVVEDSFGQEHVRGEHANLTYRVNGVLLPQPINEFGQELDTRLIDSLSLVTGSLPAQYGFHTAGIVDVQTKSGDTLKHNELSLYGGSFDTINPAVEVGGTSGKLDYFVTASYKHNDIGVENPMDSYRALHDYTDQERFFGYFSYRLDDTSRFSLLVNAAYADFQIPNSRGIAPAFPLAGTTGFDSANLDENQNEQEYYVVASYQKTDNDVAFQLSGFTRYGQITFNPDATGDLIFNGVSSGIYNSYLTSGVQFDSSYIVNDKHTLRAGFIGDYTAEQQNSSVGVFPTDADGAPTADTPNYISDHADNYGWEAGVYIQDEWRLTPELTLNSGLRYDAFIANFDNEDQLSPRVNLVLKVDPATTFHTGYARYFVPPSIQNANTETISKFAGTTNAPENFIAGESRVERSNYFDMGVSRQMNENWTIGLDGFYKESRNLVDLGQFGAALLLSPFNYKAATVYGAELSTTVKQGGFSAYGNLSWVETRAHDIDSQQFLISNHELAFISDHDIHLDHDSEFSGSAGVQYEWKSDRVYADILYGSGLRTGFANTGQVAPHHPVNIGWEHVFKPLNGHGDVVRLRVDVVNIFDEKYQLRDGDGIGVGAPQYGERLGVFAGITYQF